jgi:uncharacterized membrane protein
VEAIILLALILGFICFWTMISNLNDSIKSLKQQQHWLATKLLDKWKSEDSSKTDSVDRPVPKPASEKSSETPIPIKSPTVSREEQTAVNAEIVDQPVSLCDSDDERANQQRETAASALPVTPNIRGIPNMPSRPPTIEFQTNFRQLRLSPWSARAKIASRKTWNWFLFGHTRRPKAELVEYSVAGNWLLRLGILILITGIGFFLKYSIDRGLLAPHWRITMTTVVGFAMIGVGSRMLNRFYHLIGEGLIGGGIATLYFSIFASSQLYHLINQTISTSLMIGVTGISFAIAIRYKSMLIAILGTLGGLITPALISTNAPSLPGLYCYLLLLAAGVLAISVWKNWYLLKLLSVVGTYGYLITSGVAYYNDEKHFALVLIYWILFYILYTANALAFYLLRRKRSNVIDIVQVLSLSALTLVVLGSLIDDHCDAIEPAAWLTVGMGLYNLACLGLVRLRRLDDAGIGATLAATIFFCVGATGPILLGQNHLAPFWALEGLATLWIARQTRVKTLWVLSNLLLLFSILWMFFDSFDLYLWNWGTLSANEYFSTLVERIVAFGIPIATFFAAGYLLRKDAEQKSLMWWYFIVAISSIFVCSTAELALVLHYFAPKMLAGGISILWSIYALAMVSSGIRWREKELRIIGLLLFLIVVVKVFFFDMGLLDTLYRVGAFIVLGLLIIGGSFVYLRCRDFFVVDDETEKRLP